MQQRVQDVRIGAGRGDSFAFITQKMRRRLEMQQWLERRIFSKQAQAGQGQGRVIAING